MHTTLFIVGLLACGLFASAAAAEDWAGLGGGGLRHNAAATSVDPGGLAKLWQRSFPCLPIGDQAGPNNERDLAAGKGARNLVLADGRVALIATERADVPNAEHDYYLTVLDAATGRTATSVRIRSSRGNSRVYRWPHYGVSMSGDNVTGIVQVGWDAETGILFAAQGAYNASYTAWLPMADAGDPPPGAPADAVPAFARLRAEHPGLQDAFGRTAADLFTVFGPSDLRDRLEPFTWGLSGCFIAAAERNKEKPARYDSDWQTLFGRQGSSYYNTSGYFSVDPAGPLIVQCKGADWGHNSAGDAYVFNKHTGLKAAATMPDPLPGRRLRPFTVQGAMVGNGRMFLAGPADGELGTARPEGNVPKRDQGLYLWAYDVAPVDVRPNDGYAGPGRAETARLTPVFAHRFASRFTPDPDDIMSFGQSYYECDGFYRPKAMMIDGRGVWFAWKPGAADAVELIHADEHGATTWSLDVGRGQYGVDLWPKISLAGQGATRSIVYFTGYAQHRRRIMPDDVEAALRRIHGPAFAELSEHEIANTRRQAAQAGIWEGELRPPRGPAELAVFDVAAGRLRWTYNVSGHHDSLPANAFWTHLDQTAMVVAGRWAYLGWVDTTGERAVLRLLAFDTDADRPAPIERAIDLGFASRGNAKSALFDLVAADGRLYALVTQSDRLWIRDPRWTWQHVVALGAAAR